MTVLRSRAAYSVVAMLGPTGAGKTSLSRRLAAHFGAAHLSCGDLLRSILGQDSPAGAEARRCASAEIPAYSAAEVTVREALGRTLPHQHVCLDGFPRSLPQVVSLDRCVAALGGNLGLVIQLEVDEATALARLRRRLVCPNCGTVCSGNRGSSAQCDWCGQALVRRVGDDDPNVVHRRHAFFDRDVTPVIGHYSALGRLARLDGRISEDEIFGRACAVLRSAFGPEVAP